MRLIWYNRDKFSDQDIIRAKAVADRLLGKKIYWDTLNMDTVIEEMNAQMKQVMDTMLDMSAFTLNHPLLLPEQQCQKKDVCDG